MAEYLALVQEWWPSLMEGAWNMVKMAVAAFVVAIISAIPLAGARMSRHLWLSGPARVYIDIMRGTPLLVVLFLIYYVLPSVLGLVLPAFTAAVLGIGFYYAAYIAQTYRAGIAAVDRGQREAAQAIGLRAWQWFPAIILPQAIPVIIPPTGNYLIWIIQDTALASLISAPELMLIARQISAEYFTPFEVYVTVGLIYLAIGFVLAQVLGLLAGRGRKARETSDLSRFYW